MWGWHIGTFNHLGPRMDTSLTGIQNWSYRSLWMQGSWKMYSWRVIMFPQLLWVATDPPLPHDLEATTLQGFSRLMLNSLRHCYYSPWFTDGVNKSQKKRNSQNYAATAGDKTRIQESVQRTSHPGHMYGLTQQAEKRRAPRFTAAKVDGVSLSERIVCGLRE